MPSCELDAWYEWRARCEIERCSATARGCLNTFGDRILRSGLSRLPEEVRRNLDLFPGYGFALLETHALSHTHTDKTRDRARQGKSYKDGMFLQAQTSQDPPLRVLQGKAHEMIRTAARERWIGEAEEEGTHSLEAALDAEGTRHLDDRLADPYEYGDTGLRELLAIAEQEAPRIFAAMTFVERVILLARRLGLPYSNSPAVRHVTGKSTSTLGDQYKGLYKQRRHLPLLVAEYPNEDRETMALLYRMVLGACETLAVDWGRSDMPCAPLFVESDTVCSAAPDDAP